MLLMLDFHNGNGNQLEQTGGALFLQIKHFPDGTLIFDNQLLVLVNLAYGITVLVLSGMIIILIYKILSNF